VALLKNHLCIQGKSTDFLGAREIFDLLDCGEVGALTTFFHIRCARSASGKKDVLTEMKEGLFRPKRVILGGLDDWGRKNTPTQEENERVLHHRQHSGKNQSEQALLQYTVPDEKIDKRASLRGLVAVR